MSSQDSGQTTPRSYWLTRGQVAAGGLILVVAVACAVGHFSVDEEVADATASDVVLIDQPAVVAAPALPPRTMRVSPGSRVLGVTVGGHHRAYLLASLTSVRRHVVNDLLGGVPITVAYCDRTDCANAYTAAGRSKPLDLAVGGWDEAGTDSGMLVRVGPHRYHQHSGRPLDETAPPFPYDGVEVERTTWAEWRAAHPGSDVYVGGETLTQ